MLSMRVGRQQPMVFRDAASASPSAAAAAAAAGDGHGTAAHQLPPPPLYSLEDRVEASPEFASALVAPRVRSDAGTATPSSSSFADFTQLGYAGGHEQELPSGGTGVVLDAAACQRNIVRPELARAAVSYSPEGEEWVTVFGFGVDETKLVLREFEKCGPIVNYVPGPGSVNWIHLQYENSYDAQLALQKNGMYLNTALIVGVKPLDRLQRLALMNKVPLRPSPSMPLPLAPPGKSSTTAPAWRPSSRSFYLHSAQTGASTSAVTLASPVKSSFSRLVDLVFGV